MENLTIEQWMEKFPYLVKMADYTLFTSKQEVELIRNSEKIEFDFEEVSIEFLKRILNNNLYFEYASRYFKNEINSFSVAYIIGGDLCGSVCYKKGIIIKALEKLIQSGGIMLGAEEKRRYDILKNSISFKAFCDRNKGNTYNINIDENNYTISVEQIIYIMQLPDDDFDNICYNPEIKDIAGIPKEHFIYATFKFFKINNVIEDFLLPDNIINRYRAIASLEKIDLQALNKHLTTTDTKYIEVEIDSDLEQAIIEGMPENATELEKAIYIYIKMCKLLTYDDEYYAVNQTGIATAKHRNVDYVSSITLRNNKVVCFEFNLIYSKLLNKLGINFSSDYRGMIDEAYGDGHVNLEFRYKKFLVSADAVISILQGDITKAKLNQPLVGLKCINKNLQTQEEFKSYLTKMYQLIAKQEKSIINSDNVEHVQTLDELLSEYSLVTDNIQDVSLEERLSVLIDKVNSTKMVGIDALSYILQLRKILFTEEQRRNNISVTILRNNEPFEEGKIAMASAIFTLNRKGFDEETNQNIYYYFNPNHELILITKEQLQEMFDVGLLDYIEKKDPRIPGIIEHGGIKR